MNLAIENGAIDILEEEKIFKILCEVWCNFGSFKNLLEKNS